MNSSLMTWYCYICNITHAKDELAPKYIPNYCIIKHTGDKSVDIVDQTGKIRWASIKDIQPMYTSEFLLSALPQTAQFGLLPTH